MSITLYQLLPIALLYVICAFLPGKWHGLRLAGTILACALHGLALVAYAYEDHTLRTGFAVVLSVIMWVSVFAYLLENRKGVLDSMRVLVLPVAAVAVALPGFFPGSVVPLEGKSAWFVWHIAVSLCAYSVLTIAAFHAVLMVMQETRLQPAQMLRKETGFARALDRLPALLVMERILFRLIDSGFLLLSLSLFSGLVFTEEVLGRGLVWDHKTVFSGLSWLLFGTLIVGRRVQGWRGRTALRVTLAGFMVLLFAYIGSRFVMEVVLHRIAS